MNELVRPAAEAWRLDWSAAYARHAEELMRFAVKLLGDRERGAEIAQDAFVQAMRGEQGLREPAAIRPWLFKITANLVSNEIRRRRLLAFVPFTGRERQADNAFDAQAMLVHRALASIAPAQAITLVLHHQQGFTLREIAQMTGVGEEAVKSRLARGRESFVAAYRWMERDPAP